MLLVGISLFALTACENATSFRGSSSNMNHNYSNGQWTVTAGRVNGNLRRSFSFSSENIENFRVISNILSEGLVELVLTQGDTIETIALTANSAAVQPIDMSAFDANVGRIQVRLNFSSVRNLNLIIAWN